MRTGAKSSRRAIVSFTDELGEPRVAVGEGLNLKPRYFYRDREGGWDELSTLKGINRFASQLLSRNEWVVPDHLLVNQQRRVLAVEDEADLVASRPWVNPEAMSETTAVPGRASDGMWIHGFMTLPKSRKPEVKPPLRCYRMAGSASRLRLWRELRRIHGFAERHPCARSLSLRNGLFRYL